MDQPVCKLGHGRCQDAEEYTDGSGGFSATSKPPMMSDGKTGLYLSIAEKIVLVQDFLGLESFVEVVVLPEVDVSAAFEVAVYVEPGVLLFRPARGGTEHERDGCVFVFLEDTDLKCGPARNSLRGQELVEVGRSQRQKVFKRWDYCITRVDVEGSAHAIHPPLVEHLSTLLS